MAATVRVREDELPTVPLRPTSVEQRLRWSNLVAGVLYSVQGAAILALAEPFPLPVTASFPTGPPGRGEPVLDELFPLPLGPAVAGLLAVSALFHLLVASRWGFPRYIRGLRRRQNRFRWAEQSLSASLVVALSAMLAGIGDVAALLALAGLGAAAVLPGWQVGAGDDRRGEVVRSALLVACLLGAVPWLGIGIYLWAPRSGTDPATFVYVVVGTAFAFCTGSAVNQWLQHARAGRWRRYEVGEAAYVALGLVAKSALAWQVFANVLVS